MRRPLVSFSLSHPCNIMWDEGNCYGKLNEIKREKQLHSPLSCVISELSLWWSCPDGLRVWWSWQPAAPGPDGSPISGLLSFIAVYLPEIPCTRLFPSLSFSAQGWWPFNYHPHSEQTDLSPQFQGVCAWDSFFMCTWCIRVPSSVHIVRLSIDSLTQTPHQLGIIFELELGMEKKMSQKDTDIGSEKHRALHPECLQCTLELYQRPSFFVHRALFFFCLGSICHWEAVEREEKLDPAGRTGHLEALHLRTVLW